MATSQRPTLLVFTLGPGREQARKRWLGSRFASLESEVHQQCLDRVLTAGRDLGCRLRICTPPGLTLAADADVDHQTEGGFGQRLLGAVRRALRDAPGPLIVVGADSPQLDAPLLRHAERLMAEDDERVVVGPACDGGVYLLAAAKPLTRELEAVRWRSRNTLRSLLAALRAAGRPVHLLRPLHDLDDRRDLETWLAAGSSVASWRRLIASLRAALRSLAALPGATTAPPPLIWARAAAGRGPPPTRRT